MITINSIVKCGAFLLALISFTGCNPEEKNTDFKASKQYVIKARISNKVASIAVFPSLQQKEYSSLEEQMWKFEKNADSTYTIINKAYEMALTSPDSTRKAAFLFLTPVDHSLQQKWVIRKMNKENIALVSMFSNQALDIMEGNHFNGAFIMQWPLGSENQYWQITHHRDDGYFFLKAFVSGKMLTADCKPEQNGANIYQWQYEGKDWQKWTIEQVGDNAFKILSVQSKKVMQVSTGLHTQPGNIEQGEYCAMPWQHWRLLPIKDGYQFQSVFSGKVIDVIINGTINGTNLVEFDNHKGENQIFIISEAN